MKNMQHRIVSSGETNVFVTQEIDIFMPFIFFQITKAQADSVNCKTSSVLKHFHVLDLLEMRKSGFFQ